MERGFSPYNQLDIESILKLTHNLSPNIRHIFGWLPPSKLVSQNPTSHSLYFPVSHTFVTVCNIDKCTYAWLYSIVMLFYHVKVWALPFKTYLRTATPNKGDILQYHAMSAKVPHSLQIFHVLSLHDDIHNKCVPWLCRLSVTHGTTQLLHI